MAKFYECGICGYVHPWDWEGECLDDALVMGVDKISFIDALPDDEVLTWEDRLKADLWGDHVTD